MESGKMALEARIACESTLVAAVGAPFKTVDEAHRLSHTIQGSTAECSVNKFGKCRRHS